MGLREEILPYMDAAGYVNPTSSNTIRVTSEYYLALFHRGELTAADVAKFYSLMEALQVSPGLYERTLTSPDQEGPDDYVALVNAAQFIAPLLAKDIWLYGQNQTPLRLEVFVKSPFLYNLLMKFGYLWRPLVRYNYNNVNPGAMNRSSWLGRQRQLVAHICYGAGVTPSLFDRLYHTAVLAFSGKPGDQDSWALSWHMWQTVITSYATRLSMTGLYLGTPTLLYRVALWNWKRRFAKAYPGGIKQVFSDYYGVNHPLAKYSEDV